MVLFEICSSPASVMPTVVALRRHRYRYRCPRCCCGSASRQATDYYYYYRFDCARAQWRRLCSSVLLFMQLSSILGRAAVLIAFTATMIHARAREYRNANENNEQWLELHVSFAGEKFILQFYLSIVFVQWATYCEYQMFVWCGGDHPCVMCTQNR